MRREQQPHDCAQSKQGCEQGDEWAPDERNQYAEHDPESPLGKKQWSDGADVPVPGGPQVHVDGSRGQHQGRSQHQDRGGRGRGPPTACADNPSRAKTAVQAHVSPKTSGGHLPKCYPHF